MVARVETPDGALDPRGETAPPGRGEIGRLARELADELGRRLVEVWTKLARSWAPWERLWT